MDDSEQNALRDLMTIAQLRERKAMARSARARQAAHSVEQECLRREEVAAALRLAGERAGAAQLRHLLAGQTVPVLQPFSESAETRWRAAQPRLIEARRQLQQALAEAQAAARAVVAAQERTAVYQKLVADGRLAREAEADEGGEG